MCALSARRVYARSAWRMHVQVTSVCISGCVDACVCVCVWMRVYVYVFGCSLCIRVVQCTWAACAALTEYC